jgi:TAP-like protein
LEGRSFSTRGCRQPKATASGFWFASVFGDVMFPELFVRGQYAAAGHADAHAASEYFSDFGPTHASNIGYAATALIWGGGKLDDAWPATAEEDEYDHVQPSEVETLLIGGEVDFSTPPQIATRELLPYLPNGQEVVLPGVGHTGSFFAAQPEAGTRLINTFFDSGRVDDSLYKPEKIDFTPARTLTGIAKVVAGTIVGLALLAVLSLLWMARRVRKRGRFGRRTSAMLRSLYPVVLGLGGWCLGALIVLTTMPGIRVDGELFAVLTIGLPVGLGIYFAWVNRDWSARTKATGFTGAAGGALLGAWLGFHATGGLLALVTAIIGAAVAANLILLVLDIAWDRKERESFRC